MLRTDMPLPAQFRDWVGTLPNCAAVTTFVAPPDVRMTRAPEYYALVFICVCENFKGERRNLRVSFLAGNLADVETLARRFSEKLADTSAHSLEKMPELTPLQKIELKKLRAYQKPLSPAQTADLERLSRREYPWRLTAISSACITRHSQCEYDSCRQQSATRVAVARKQATAANCTLSPLGQKPARPSPRY